MSGRGPEPLTRQRSTWVEQEIGVSLGIVGGSRIWQRNVHDGHLTVILSPEPDGLHLSISHRTNGSKPKPGRYPTWDEITDARYALAPDEVTFAMILPPPGDYVACHPTTFHLHEIPAEYINGPVNW